MQWAGGTDRLGSAVVPRREASGTAPARLVTGVAGIHNTRFMTHTNPVCDIFAASRQLRQKLLAMFVNLE